MAKSGRIRTRHFDESPDFKPTVPPGPGLNQAELKKLPPFIQETFRTKVGVALETTLEAQLATYPSEERARLTKRIFRVLGITPTQAYTFSI